MSRKRRLRIAVVAAPGARGARRSRRCLAAPASGHARASSSIRWRSRSTCRSPSPPPPTARSGSRSTARPRSAGSATAGSSGCRSRARASSPSDSRRRPMAASGTPTWPASMVSRMTPSGAVSSVPIDTPIVRLGRLAVAPDGAAWFAEATSYSITRVKDGELTRYPFASVFGRSLRGRGRRRRRRLGDPSGGQPAAAHRARRQPRDFQPAAAGAVPTDVAVARRRRGLVRRVPRQQHRPVQGRPVRLFRDRQGERGAQRHRGGGRRRGLVRHAARREPRPAAR